MSVISIAASLYTIRKVSHMWDLENDLKTMKNPFLHNKIIIMCALCVFLQQYVMLHDMVASHSVVRVSVCRGNKGMSKVLLHIPADKRFAQVANLLTHCSVHLRYWTGHVNRACAWWCHFYPSQWDGNALRCRSFAGNLRCKREHADRWGCLLWLRCFEAMVPHIFFFLSANLMPDNVHRISGLMEQNKRKWLELKKQNYL